MDMNTLGIVPTSDEVESGDEGTDVLLVVAVTVPGLSLCICWELISRMRSSTSSLLACIVRRHGPCGVIVTASELHIRCNDGGGDESAASRVDLRFLCWLG